MTQPNGRQALSQTARPSLMNLLARGGSSCWAAREWGKARKANSLAGGWEFAISPPAIFSALPGTGRKANRHPPWWRR